MKPFLSIKREEFPAALLDLIGLITSTDFKIMNRYLVSDNRFHNLSRFTAIVLMFTID